MPTLKIAANASHLAKMNTVYIAKNSIGVTNVEFTLSPDWNETLRTVVFAHKSLQTPIYVHIAGGNSCLIPADVTALTDAISIGIIGARGNGTYLIPTNFVTERIYDGTYNPEYVPPEPTPDVYQQIINIMEQQFVAADAAQGAQNAAEAARDAAVDAQSAAELARENVDTNKEAVEELAGEVASAAGTVSTLAGQVSNNAAQVAADKTATVTAAGQALSSAGNASSAATTATNASGASTTILSTIQNTLLPQIVGHVTAAGDSAAASAASAAAAEESEENASDSAENALNSATVAGNSATAAATKAGEAAGSATNAASSAAAAGTARTGAEAAQLASEASRVGAETARDQAVTAKNEAAASAAALASVYTRQQTDDRFTPSKTVQGVSLAITDHLDNSAWRKLLICGGTTLSGEPSPDNPATMTDKGECNAIARGRNLFDPAELVRFATANSNQSLYPTTVGTYQGRPNVVRCRAVNNAAGTDYLHGIAFKAGQYRISFDIFHEGSGRGVSFGVKYTDGTAEQAVPAAGNGYNTWYHVTLATNPSKTIKSLALTYDNNTIWTCIDLDTLQITEGPTEYPYTPYGYSSIAIPALPGLPMPAGATDYTHVIGDQKWLGDTLEWLGGDKWRYTQRVARKTWKGTESWIKNNATYDQNNTIIFSLFLNPGALNNIENTAALCTHLPVKGLTNLRFTDAGAINTYFTQAEIKISKSVLTPYGTLDTYANMISALKAYLAAQYAAGTPMSAVYQITTPITTELTLGKLDTVNGAMVAEQDGDHPAWMIAEYNRDIMTALNELTAAIVALQGGI